MQRNNTDIGPLRDAECFLLDMDGTIYLDTTLFDGTLEFLRTLKEQGKRYLYITNNSSRSAREYVKKLERIGIAADESEFCTSADALVFFLNKEHPGARLYLVGTPALQEFLEEQGFTILSEYTDDPTLRPDYVVLGFDTTVTYEKLRIASDYLIDGIPFWATHPDMVCPMRPGHPVPDAGAFMRLFEGATGRRPDFIAGKPNPGMINMCVEKYGLAPGRVAVIGDRLNTDIMSAKNAGVLSICVLTGEATLEDIDRTPEAEKPDYVFDSIKDVFEIVKR